MIRNEGIFKDDRLPNRLLHRERESEHLLRQWSRRADLILHGSSGVGKTTLLRHCLQRFERMRGAETAHVAGQASAAGVLRDVLAALPGPTPAQTTPEADLALKLQERVDGPTIVVLDEADDIDTTAIRRLHDVEEIAIVVVAHNATEWLSMVDGPVHRQLSGTEFRLKKFSTVELADILERRADVGLVKGAVSRAQLETIADESAGVARRGIQVLRAAAEEAARHGQKTIRDPDIDAAYGLAERRIRELALASLGFHHHLLYELVRASDEIRAEALHTRYDELAGRAYDGRPQCPVTRGHRRRQLRKLEDYGLIGSAGQGRGASYHIEDRNIPAPIDTDLPLQEPDI